MPEKFEEMVDIYRRNTQDEVPGLEGRIRTLESDLRLNEKRLENLTLRIADLPPEVSADPLYRQMRDLQAKAQESKSTRSHLQAQTIQAKQRDIDEEGLKARLARAVGALDVCTADQRTGVFANVLKFAEIHPTRIRLGVLAPTKKAPGAGKDAGPSGFSNFALNFPVNFAGSTSVLNGG